MENREFAKTAGLPVETVRSCCKTGPVSPWKRTPSGYRRYREIDLGRIGLGRRARTFGFTFDKIREMSGLIRIAADHLPTSERSRSTDSWRLSTSCANLRVSVSNPTVCWPPALAMIVQTVRFWRISRMLANDLRQALLSGKPSFKKIWCSLRIDFCENTASLTAGRDKGHDRQHRNASAIRRQFRWHSPS